MTLSPELERVITIRIIQEDAESIYSLLASERNSIFSMGIVPYYSLFVQSCQEYLEDDFLPESISLKVKDIRNYIKVFAESFGKSKRRVHDIDDEQDVEYKSKLRFKFMKSWNIHHNLGTYWTNDRHVVGNTQQLADYLGVDNPFDKKAGKKQYDFAFQLSSFIASIRGGLGASLPQPEVIRPCSAVKISKYHDLNTNKENALFLDHSSKEVNLFYLNLLCNMNFVKYILRPLFENGNIWIFRVEYIVTYYTFKALQRIKNYAENNSDIVVDTNGISKILNSEGNLFQSKFRNCMMHYDLENRSVLSAEYITKPFYGIVESCFDGLDYFDYLKLLRELSDRIIVFLESYFDCKNVPLMDL